jgi:hypothetical protein
MILEILLLSNFIKLITNLLLIIKELEGTQWEIPFKLMMLSKLQIKKVNLKINTESLRKSVKMYYFCGIKAS